jgi:threonine/homoserine/homoserine lactone efflux protein
MHYDVLYALILFAFVAAVTPGPNNLMLMASGVNFGFRRTLPHLLGVCLGFPAMVALVGFGLDAIFSHFPGFLTALRYVSVAYMLWLANKIATAGPVHETDVARKPLGFFGAAAFQWVNPKGWVMAVSALTTYTVMADYAHSAGIVVLVFLLLAFPASGVWVLSGAAMRPLLSNPARVRPFNWTMAALLLASIAPVLVER